MARINLRLVEGRTDLPYKSLQESLAILAWRKEQRVELLKTIAVVTAAVNPEKAQEALRKLIEEMFPEVAAERGKAVDRAMQIMEREKKRVYSIAPAGQSSKSTPFGRIQNILKKNRRGR